MENTFWEKFLQNYNDAQMLVIGFGRQLHKSQFESEAAMSELMDFYSKCLDKKNYFIITSHKEGCFKDSKFNLKRVCNPLDSSEEQGQWELYNKWLSASLNKKLMIVELGEDFNNPNVFRWPFEKIVFINQKSKMYRVSDKFYQLPENIGERAVSVPENAIRFLIELREYLG